MDRLQQLRVFEAVADECSFAAAARRLNVSPPAVTRAVSALEAALAVQLLKRTTRHVRLTEVGARYLASVRHILADLEAADAAAAGVIAKPSGLLRVTAPSLFGRMFVVPVVAEYLQHYPQVSVEALLLDRVVNLLEEGVDVGLRIGELRDLGLRVRQVGSVNTVVVASPAYVQRCGTPAAPAELSAHDIVLSTAGHLSDSWRFSTAGGDCLLKLKPRLAVTTNDAAIAAAEQGLGITRVLSYQVAGALAEGRLVELLAEQRGKAEPVSIVHREGINMPAKTRAFIDLLAERLSCELAQ